MVSNVVDKKLTDVATLKVAEAEQRDIGRKIVRIDPQAAQSLDVITGDALELSSFGKKSFLLSWPGRDKDRGTGLVRIDGYTRNKLDVGIGDTIEVKKVESEDAKSITLAPTEPLRIIGAEQYLVESLNGQLMTKGDIIPLNVMGQRIDLVVISTDPSRQVIINDATKVTVSEDSTKAVQATQEGKVHSITYEDIGGIRNEIARVREMIEVPLRHPELFKRVGVEAPKGVLLHGPPGTGKTLLAKAVGNESNSHFISISGPEIMSKYYGKSEEKLRNIFEQAEKNAPSIIFIDEIDSIASKREEVLGEVERRIVAQLLSLMDGLKSRGKVVVMGATNRVNAIDPALRRPGRFDRELEIGVPDREGRLEILQIHTRGMPLAKDVNLEKLADISHGFVGADLESLSIEAGMRSLRRILPNIDLSYESIPSETLRKIIVTMADFMDVIKENEKSFMIEFAIETGNIEHFISDTIALKYAQKFYGADLNVYSKLRSKLSIDEFEDIHPGKYKLIESGGSILSKKILFVGVLPLQKFDYPQIREFSSRVLDILSKNDPDIKHLAMTIHELGSGKDEIESAYSQFGGIIDALRDGNYPKSLKRITFVNTDKEVVKRLRKSFDEVLLNEQYASKVNENWLYQLKIQPHKSNEPKSTTITEIDSAGKSSAFKQTIFVAMPFKKEMNNLFHFAIQNPARNSDFLCERLDSDNEIFTIDIFSNIKKKIDSSSLIIGVLTDSNPNVYLEIGYALGKNKPILFLIKKGDIPKFDLQGFRNFVYENEDLKSLEETLMKQLQAFKMKSNNL